MKDFHVPSTHHGHALCKPILPSFETLVMTTCVIFHNMVIENEMNNNLEPLFDQTSIVG